MSCAANTVDRRTCPRCGEPMADHLYRDGGRDTYCPSYLDDATKEIGRLNLALREARRLARLPSSDLLMEWRRHCIASRRFTAPDWETGEAGMLRELLGAVLPASEVSP